MQPRNTYKFFKYRHDEKDMCEFVERFLSRFFAWSKKRNLTLTPGYEVNPYDNWESMQEKAKQLSLVLSTEKDEGKVLDGFDNILQNFHEIECSIDEIESLIEKSISMNEHGKSFFWHLWKQKEYMFRSIVNLNISDNSLVGYLSVPMIVHPEAETANKNNIKLLLDEWMESEVIDNWKIDWES